MELKKHAHSYVISTFAIIGFVLSSFFVIIPVATAQTVDVKYRVMALPAGTSAQRVMDLFSGIVGGVEENDAVGQRQSPYFPEHALAAARGDVDFFVTAPLVHLMMQSGHAPFQPTDRVQADDFRLLFMFNFGFYHIAVHHDSDIWTFGDIADKRVFLGAPGSGSDKVAETLLSALTGYQPGRDYTGVALPWKTATIAFSNRRHQVHITPALPPEPALSAVSRRAPLRLLSLTDADFDRPDLRSLFAIPGRIRGRILPSHYAGQITNTEPVQTVGAMVGVATSRALPEDVIYQIVAEFWRAVDLQSTAQSWLRWLGPDTAMMQANMQLHPGAARYYQERGLSVPAHLLPNDEK